MVREDKKNGTLTISGSLSGDQFPNAEMLIADSKQQTIFLGAFSINSGSPYSGGSTPLHLIGWGEYAMLNFNVTITLDKDGNFTGVNAGGETYTIQQWNQQFISKDPDIGD